MPADVEPVLAGVFIHGLPFNAAVFWVFRGNQSTAFNQIAPLEPNRCSANTENLHIFGALNSLMYSQELSTVPCP